MHCPERKERLGLQRQRVMATTCQGKVGEKFVIELQGYKMLCARRQIIRAPDRAKSVGYRWSLALFYIYAAAGRACSGGTRRPKRFYMRLISVSPLYLSRPWSRCAHHSNSMLSQMSLNHGVKTSLSSLNMALNWSADTYLVSLTSFGLGLRSTSAFMKRM